jgi:hypothetical protein
VRLFAIAVSLLIAGPSPAFAQYARSARAVPSVSVVPSVLPFGAALPSISVPSLGGSPLSLTPHLSAPVVSVVPLQAAVAVQPLKAAAAVLKPEALSVRALKAAAILPTLAKVPVAAAPAAAERSFALLTGELAAPRREDSSVLAAPSTGDKPAPLQPAGPPRDPAVVKNVKRMMIGTSVMKGGMETITLSVPLLAIAAFGGLSAVAGLVVAYGLAQAAFAGMSGGLADRFSARKVLAGAVAAQAVLISTVIAAGALGALSAGTLIPLYLLIGGVTGVIETTRHSIPKLLLGSGPDAEFEFKKYNAKLHIWYEVAGVAGALAAGAMIGLAGPLWALALQPPVYLAAAWYFWRVKHPAPAGVAAKKEGVLAQVKAYFTDMKAGAKLVLGDPRLRWVALAFVLPQIVHRVFENLMIPIVAKKVLENPSASAWMLTASNMGELIGAAILLRLAARAGKTSAWVRLGAAGLLLIWALAFTKSLFLLLPLILLSSLTWAAADLSLRSEVQGAVADKDQPRALSFLYGAFVLGSALLSLSLGAFLDAMPLLTAISWICAAFTALAAGVWFASRKLKK